MLSSKNKDYYITCMSFYVDVAVEVTKVLQLYTIKEISDLVNAILADGVDFGYKSNAIQITYEGKSYVFKINKIKRSKNIDDVEFVDYNFKKWRKLAYVTYEELQGDGMRFELGKGIIDQLYHKISRWFNLIDNNLRNSWCFYRQHSEFIW